MPITSRQRFRLCLTLVTVASCGGASPSVKPDDMGAAQHRQEAARETDTARREADRYQPGAVRPSPGGQPLGITDGTYSAPVYNANEGHLAAADWHRRHLRELHRLHRRLDRDHASFSQDSQVFRYRRLPIYKLGCDASCRHVLNREKLQDSSAGRVGNRVIR